MLGSSSPSVGAPRMSVQLQSSLSAKEKSDPLHLPCYSADQVYPHLAATTPSLAHLDTLISSVINWHLQLINP